MGTDYSIFLINQKNKIVDVQLLQHQVDSLLIEVNNIFSNYIDSSEINNINRHLSTKSMNISPEMAEVMGTAIMIYELSGGKFDITIKPLMDIWGFGEDYDTSQFPSDKLIKKTKEYVGFEKLLLKNNTLKKSNKLIQIDLNAIAKGWGVDKISEFIHKRGFNRYMVEIGGEISVSGKNKYNKNWGIGIPIPEYLQSELYTIINLSNLSVATSGSYNNFFNFEDVNYSHIIDPESGYPIKHDLVSATVVTKSCAFADAIATTVMVMGFNEGLNWVRILPDVECLLIGRGEDGNYTTVKSEGFNY
jgi:thiamine biosynthesis lipoprotein